MTDYFKLSIIDTNLILLYSQSIICKTLESIYILKKCHSSLDIWSKFLFSKMEQKMEQILWNTGDKISKNESLSCE